MMTDADLSSSRVRFLTAVGKLGFAGHFDEAAELRQCEIAFREYGNFAEAKALRILNRIPHEHAREAVEALADLLSGEE